MRTACGVALLLGATILCDSAPRRSTNIAGFYTPYNLTPGGGEKVFLAAIATYQSLGYEIVLFVNSDNTCRTKKCIKSTAEKLHVLDIDFGKLSLSVDSKSGRDLMSKFAIDVFFAIGNEKIPQVYPMGSLHNIYLNQFPFDLHTPVSEEDLKILSAYDTVMVYSNYVLEWYLRYTLHLFVNRNDPAIKLPSVKVVSPPVGGRNLRSVILKSIEEISRGSAAEQINIVMLGRIIVGRHNKGYHVAVPTFRRLLEADRRRHRLHLHIIGNLHQNEESTRLLNDLRANATGLPISFHLGVSTDELEALMRSGTIFWHMTGIDQPREREDPAALEHFGIANLEGMALGMIPIVTDRGGPAEATEHGVNGFTAASPQEFIDHTLRIVSMSREEQLAMRRRAVQSVVRFSVDNFRSALSTLVSDGAAASVFRDFRNELFRNNIQFTIPSLPIRSDKTAVIIEGTVDSAFEFCVRNVMHFLGEGWGLQVHHSRLNGPYVKNALKDIQNVNYVEWTSLGSDARSRDALLKSTVFWESLGTEKVLIFHSDTVVLSSKIRHFISYDYIGAPWDPTNNLHCRALFDRGLLPNSVGSGSLSVRNVSMMTHISRVYGPHSLPREKEDVLFSRAVHLIEGAVLPTHKVAYSFCKEVELPDYADVKYHASLHAAWVHSQKGTVIKNLDLMRTCLSINLRASTIDNDLC